MQQDSPKKSKQPYAKPEIRQVTLRPEEAVLGSCKTTKAGGPGNPTCNVPVCYSVGS